MSDVGSVQGESYVPPDQRVLGFDRRTAWPGIVVLIIWFVWAHGLPFVNDRIALDNPVEAGDVVDLGARQLTFVPAEGWNLDSGLLVSEETSVPTSLGSADASVSAEDVSFTVHTARFTGTAQELLDQVLNVNDALGDIVAETVGDQVAFKNVDGQPGVLVPFTGANENGLVATYVFDTAQGSVGVEVLVRAGDQADAALAKDVASMVTGITYSETPQGGGS